MHVRQVMTRDVVSVASTASLREVAALLEVHGISGLPVVDASGALVGVVSCTDVVARVCGDAPRGRHRRDGATAGGAMSSPAICIDPDRPVWEAADLMLRRRIERLPVVDGEGVLVGIVSRADLVRAFGRPDAEIEADVRAELPVDGIDVHVAAGEATLRGVVASDRDAAALVRAAARVPGVVGVADHLIRGR